ncbi:MAG: hypothetical protein ACKVU0_12040 [Saprospiraceae bacterium]
MNNSKFFACAFFCFSLTVTCFAQEAFTSCTAAFLDNKIIVDEYTPNGKCALSAASTGVLTVCTADLSPTNSIPVKQIKFMVALRDQNTKTLTMFSSETYKQIDIQKVLARCKTGDHIVLITMDDAYSLPHNEILVKEGHNRPVRAF